MMKIAVMTATRAEYGLLSSIIKKMNKDEEMDVRVVVTGAHLSSEFGNTYQEIEREGVEIDAKIPILDAGDGAVAMSKTMANALVGFSDYFECRRPDALMVLGDRYETLAVCAAAMNAQIPIIHLHGGETTQGAIDEAVRHSISKMSYLHFTSTEEYKNRVIQLGEQPERVFAVGAIGVENALLVPRLSREELEESLGVSFDRPLVVATYHPVTLEGQSVEVQIEVFLQAISLKTEYVYVITKANADAGGRKINELLEKYAVDHDNVHVVDSLGLKRYLSALSCCRMVLGNSSSGIIEAPSFHIPTINIGDRQKGRTQSATVINCTADTASIVEAMEKAETEEFRSLCKKAQNPYEQSDVADTIIKIIKREMIEKKIDLKKVFYDIK